MVCDGMGIGIIVLCVRMCVWVRMIVCGIWWRKIVCERWCCGVMCVCVRDVWLGLVVDVGFGEDNVDWIVVLLGGCG